MRYRTPTTTKMLSGMLILALLIGSFSHGFAQSRAIDPAVGLSLVVICAGNGAETILVDQDGAPVAPSQCLRELCSACLTTQSLAASDAPLLPSRTNAWRSAAFVPVAAPVPALCHTLAAQPRAPPFLA